MPIKIAEPMAILYFKKSNLFSTAIYFLEFQENKPQNYAINSSVSFKAEKNSREHLLTRSHQPGLNLKFIALIYAYLV